MARYVSSDWHGQLNLANQVMNFLQPNDKLYFLGDAIDRGSAGYEIMMKLLSDNRVTYLKGNHEDMLVQCVPEFIEGHMNNYTWWCSQNGGQTTWAEIEQLPPSAALSLVKTLNKLPKRIDLTNTKGQHLILSHAGTDPSLNSREAVDYLWDRGHIRHRWLGDNNTFIIHGHTPVDAIPDATRWMDNEDKKNIPFIPTVRFYCKGHKIDLDMNSFSTNRVALMDLDTFEVFYFETN